MRAVQRPSKSKLAQIAENQPELLNVFVAYFVFEWREVKSATVPHGVDQKGVHAPIPDYVGMWGIDRCLHYVRSSPKQRTSRGPGYVSAWLYGASQDGDESIYSPNK